MPCGVMTDGRLGMSARARRRGVTFLVGPASAAFGAAAAPAASATLDRAKLEANLVTVSTTVADSGDTSPAAARWARGDVVGREGAAWLVAEESEQILRVHRLRDEGGGRMSMGQESPPAVHGDHGRDPIALLPRRSPPCSRALS